MSSTSIAPQDYESHQTGLTAKQWTLLLFAFFLGIASVFTLSKTVFDKDHGSTNAVRAATASP